MSGIPITVLLAALAAAPAAAGPSVKLALADGRVWLVARDATVGQVFDEWSRVGGTRVVNAERVPGRVTLELAGMPEAQALDLLLRSAGGFLAKARYPEGSAPATGSRFDTIVIVAARQAPAAVAAANEPPYQPPPQAPPAQLIAPGVQRILGPDGQPVPDDQEDAPPPVPRQVSPGRSMPPGFSASPQTAPQSPPAAAPGPQVPAGAPVPGMIVPPPNQQPAPAPRPPRPPR